MQNDCPFLFSFAAGCIQAATKGTGQGEKEEKVGNKIASFDECIAAVKAKVPTANGVTYGTKGNKKGKCFAEIGQTSVKTDNKFLNCLIKAEDSDSNEEASDYENSEDYDYGEGEDLLVS